MTEERKNLEELVETLQRLNTTAVMLVQNSADTLLMYQKMRENKECKRELVQQ